MSDGDEFRKRAEQARQNAAQCPDKTDKAFWLNIARDWETLAESADKNPRPS
jgi:hypothetical protein